MLLRTGAPPGPGNTRVREALMYINAFISKYTEKDPTASGDVITSPGVSGLMNSLLLMLRSVLDGEAHAAHAVFAEAFYFYTVAEG